MADGPTVVNTGGGGTAAVVVAIFIAALLFLLFLTGGLDFTGGSRDIDLNVNPPAVDAPATPAAPAAPAAPTNGG